MELGLERQFPLRPVLGVQDREADRVAVLVNPLEDAVPEVVEGALLLVEGDLEEIAHLVESDR